MDDKLYELYFPYGVDNDEHINDDELALHDNMIEYINDNVTHDDELDTWLNMLDNYQWSGRIIWDFLIWLINKLFWFREQLFFLEKFKTNRFVFLKPVILSELCFCKNINPQVSILFCWQIAVKIKSLSTQPICVFIKTRLQDYGRNSPLQARPSR